MLDTWDCGPDPRLRHVVRRFSERLLDAGGQEFRRALPARRKQFLQFLVAGSHDILDRASGSRSVIPAVTVVGPQSYRRIDLAAQGRLRVFIVELQPTAFHALTRLPMHELADNYLDAAQLGGPLPGELAGQLREEAGFAARVRRAENALLPLAEQVRPDGVSRAAALLCRAGGRVPVGLLAQAAELSPRQLERRFEQQVGFAPRRYARVVRLELAMALREKHPDWPLTRIAHAAGYADQAHFNREHRAMVDEALGRYVRHRLLGS